MLNIFVLSTDIYNKYIPFLIKSFDNIKIDFRFILMSDEDIEYKNDKHEYIYYHIANLAYPFVTYHKIDYIVDCIKFNNIPNTDTFLYVDADTVFRPMPDIFWQNMRMFLKTDMLFFARSPFYHEDVPEWENVNNKNNCCYIENLDCTKYVQTSLFFGSIKSLEYLYNECYHLTTRMTSDDRMCPKLPFLFEQSIVNKIVSEDKSKNKFVVDDYAFNAYNIDIMNDPDFINKRYNDVTYKYKNFENKLYNLPMAFALQKFNTEIKNIKRI